MIKKIICFVKGHDWGWWYDDITFPTRCQRCGHNATDEEVKKLSIGEEEP